MLPPDDDLEEFGLAFEARAPLAPSQPPPVADPFPQPATGIPLNSTKHNNLQELRTALGGVLTANRPLTRPITKRQSVQLGITPVEVQPGQTVTSTVTPFELIKIQKWMFTESVPGSIVIKGIFIGNMSQLQGEMPSSIFAPSSLGTGLPPNTVQPGLTISINVMNIGKVPCVWGGAIFGETLR